MFGLVNNRVKKTLQKAVARCLAPLQDELGNVPVEMQTHVLVNAYLLGICEGYAESNKITKPQSIAVIVDAVFEEIYRRESTQVLTTIDQWRNEKNSEFLEAFEKTKASTTETLDIDWFKQYATSTFEPANNLML
jgi:hypothetical protein